MAKRANTYDLSIDEDNEKIVCKHDGYSSCINNIYHEHHNL